MDANRRTPLLIAAAIAIAAVVVFGFVLDDDTDTAADRETTTEVATGEERQGAGGKEEVEPVEREQPARPKRELIEVKGASPVGGVQRLEYGKGDRIRLKITSDVADHVHVHGYDLFEDVSAGGQAKFSFAASIDGVFEIELEDRGVQIAELRVSP